MRHYYNNHRISRFLNEKYTMIRHVFSRMIASGLLFPACYIDDHGARCRRVPLFFEWKPLYRGTCSKNKPWNRDYYSSTICPWWITIMKYSVRQRNHGEVTRRIAAVAKRSTPLGFSAPVSINLLVRSILTDNPFVNRAPVIYNSTNEYSVIAWAYVCKTRVIV